MNLPDRSSSSARQLGARVRQAREALDLSQQDVAGHLQFNDRQTLSDIENGDRRVRPEELVKFSELLRRPLDWFLEPFVVAGEAGFSWRVAPDLPDETLRGFEDRIGPQIGLLRFLRRCRRRETSPFAERLWLTKRSTYDDAAAQGEAVAAKLQLGSIPAARLVECIESQLDIPVLYVDGEPQGGISGAMCRLTDVNVMLINRHESLVRRHFDTAHELFHALTWDALPPKPRESAEPMGKKGDRVERLADNFAAALLIPRKSLDELLDRSRLDDHVYLAQLARTLQVSTLTLGWRLVNLELISKEQCAAIGRVPLPPLAAPLPKRLSPSFVEMLRWGIDAGHVSSRKAAKALSMTMDGMAALLEEHGHQAPFAH